MHTTSSLRIALTCPEQSPSSYLPFEQIRLAAQAAVSCGVRRFELCGGEPLEREDIPVLCMMLSSLTVVEDMSLTTDGVLLPRWAKALRGAGVSRVIVKLDTFDPGRYRAIIGSSDLTAVLAGIRSLMEVGFPPATIEARLIGGVNASELPSLVRLTKMTGISLRLMELTGEEAAACGGTALPIPEALARLPELVPESENVHRLPGAEGTVTFVPVSAREAGCLCLDTDGMLRNAQGASACLCGMEKAAVQEAVRALL